MRTILVLLFLCACVSAVSVTVSTRLVETSKSPKTIKSNEMNSLVELKRSFDSMLRDFHKKLEELHGEIRDRVALVRRKLEEVAKRLEKPKRAEKKFNSSVTKEPRKANVNKETTTV